MNSKFSPLVKFMKGCPPFRTLATDRYGSYVNELGIWEMHQAIANTLV